MVSGAICGNDVVGQVGNSVAMGRVSSSTLVVDWSFFFVFVDPIRVCC